MTKALMLLLGIVSLAEAYHHHHHHQGIGKVVVGRRNARFPSLLSRQIELQLDLFPSFSPDDQWGLYSVVSTAAATALRLERTTIIGAGLSGPVTAMLITALLTNVGILPAAGSIHLINLQGFVLRLATPLLLLGADMRKIFRETGRMLQAFMLGTIGTLLGSFIAMLLLSGPIGTVGLPGDGWKVAAALTAKNIGGGLNFFAVTNALELSPASLAAGLAIDNLLGLCYFPFISWLGAPHDENNRWSKEEEEIGERKDVQLGEDRIDDTQRPANEAEKISILSSGSENQGIPPSTEHLLEQGDHRPADDVEKMMSAVAVATITAALAESISHALNVPSLSVPISTVLAVMFATLFPQQLNQLTDQGELLGKLLLLLFFASIGNASGTIASTFAATGAIYLLAFGMILYAVHLSVVLGIGKMCGIPLPDLLMASNANIGNAATASSLATSKGWKSRLLPGILVGTLGNAIGTFCGLFLGVQVLKPLSGF